MTREIASLTDIASEYDAVVLDQWGVLHDGSAPYPSAINALQRLRATDVRLAVLSNSGKRAQPNEHRIISMGFPSKLFDTVSTSGEVLWNDINSGRIAGKTFMAIERTAGDASQWAEGLAISLTDEIEHADAILLMGLPDDTELAEWDYFLDRALTRNLTVVCSNPDLCSPRAGGRSVVSPGALAKSFEKQGGTVLFYGKPYRSVFSSLEGALGIDRLLMVGDSLDHDIAGAHGAGWDSVLVEDGLYAAEFATGDKDETLARLCAVKGVKPPTYRLGSLK